MRRVEASTDTLTIEFCVDGVKRAEIKINPSFPGGCRKIYSAISHDSELSRNTLENIRNEHDENVVIDYMQGKFDVAGELIDGIAEAIGPSQYETIADLLPCIEMRHLIVLALSIIESYSKYYTGLLSEGFKKRGE